MSLRASIYNRSARGYFGREVLRPMLVQPKPSTSARIRPNARGLGIAGLCLGAACGSGEAERKAQEQAMAPAELGARLLERHACLRCHAGGEDRKHGPTLAGIWGTAVELEDGSTAMRDEAYMRESIVHPGRAIARGYKATMPSYQTRLEPYELEAILAALRSRNS